MVVSDPPRFLRKKGLGSAIFQSLYFYPPIDKHINAVYIMVAINFKRRCIMQTAKLFINGRSQAVRLPKEYRFEGDDVYIKKIGKMVVLLPKDDPWAPLVNSLDQFTDDFMETRDQLMQDVRDDL